MPPTSPENPTPSRRYSVFVSYSRRDDAVGWVEQLVEALRREAREVLDDGFEVFFDRHDLRTREEWQTQLAWAVREAEVLMVCVSKPYFESDFCLWEFQEYEVKPMGPDTGEGLVPVLLEDTAEQDQPDQEHRYWHARVTKMQGQDLKDVFTRDAAPTLEGAEDRIRDLGDDLYQQRQNRRRWEGGVGNLARGTSRFVGRHQELSRLGEVLASSSTIGVVTAVRGLGGIGKTELVRHYGNQHRGHYAGGIWQIPAEGAREMLPLLARLAPDLPGFLLPEEVQGNPELTGRHVLMELRRRATIGGHVLLILDNVSEPALLTDPQVGVLPQDSGVHVAVTTRLGTEDFAGSSRLEQIHLQGLSIRESVSLLQVFQPSSSGGHRADFRSEDDRAAAEELAELLDGFTLAVEQAGVYLSTHPEVTVRDYLDHLRSQSLTASDAMLDDDSKTRIEHREKLLSVILDQSLTDLEHTLPGSLRVLRLAAAMPPETIPWPWLEELTKRTNPEVCESTPQFLKGRWTRIRRTLEGRDLITEGRHPGATGRMHRLIADHLKTHNPPETDLVDEFITHRARKLGDDFTQAPELWEIDTLADALPDILTRKPELLKQVPDFIRFIALNYVTDTRITAMLYDLAEKLSGTSTQTGFLAHSLLGDTLRNTDPIQARESYQKSLAITRHLAEIWPEDLQARRDLTVALNNVAGMLKYSDPGQALGLYRESLDIGRDLAAQLSGDFRVRRDLTVSLDNVAGMLKASDPGQALRLYRESLDIRRDLAAQLSGDFQARRDLTVALNNVAGMLKYSDPGQALRLYRESLDIRRDLAAQLSGDFQARRDLTVALNNVAGMLKYSDPGQALGLYRESLDIGRELVTQLPGNLQVLWDLAVSAARLAQLLSTEDPERVSLWREAAISFRDALAIQPEHRELGRLSYQAALDYADCDPDDRDEWLAYAAELAERFGFGKQ
ncbi:TIR domain-containing protein [Arachnia propionica]|uniref:tetratricopeptide repeat protein n=1 Tax=Arachnia propionica TaxID=1750 RepID=UPI0028F0036C|nr:TIR domain-containing protein [Arachnia propionica]